MIGALAVLVYAFPYIGLLNANTSALVVLAVVLSIVCHDMMYGPQAAFIAESFPTRLRYSGASLGYQLASVVAGGPAPLIAAWLLHTFHSGYAISAYMATWRCSPPAPRPSSAPGSAPGCRSARCRAA